MVLATLALAHKQTQDRALTEKQAREIHITVVLEPQHISMATGVFSVAFLMWVTSPRISNECSTNLW